MTLMHYDWLLFAKEIAQIQLKHSGVHQWKLQSLGHHVTWKHRCFVHDSHDNNI